MSSEMKAVQAQLDRLRGFKNELYQGDFLLTWQRSREQLDAVLMAASILESLHRQNIATRVFQSGLAVSIFRDQSTRTRFSFASAADLLGLGAQELDEQRSQIAHGETVRETANMISFLAEAIGIRDDIFLGEGHRYMTEVAHAVQEGFDGGVLAQRPAVINLQCDLDHPTQSMADLMHLQTVFGSAEALRGKKIAMTWAYSPSYGKPLSVPQGIITLMTRFGMHVTLAHPPGYDLVPECLEHARHFAAESDGSFAQTHSMEEAFQDADVVYPKSWAPFSVMQERTKLLRDRQTAALKDLEQQCLANNSRHQDWECNARLMRKTRDGKALYMHCLPADISGVSCPQGEVSAEVFEKYRLANYREASHKPFIIAAMILLARFERPGEILHKLIQEKKPRRAG